MQSVQDKSPIESLLIAEDDAVARRTLEFIFKKMGFQVIAVPNGKAALSVLEDNQTPFVIILDILMPGMSGTEVCKRICSMDFLIPPYIIMLTVKGSRDDIVQGLGAGADDYITKPFDLDELQARVQVGVKMLRLQHRLAAKVRELEESISRVKQLQHLLRKDTHVYEFGEFRLEAAERRVLRQGKSVQLTKKMFDLLLLLVQNRGQLIEKEEIMESIWPNISVEENNLTVNISTLRKALGEEQGRHFYIETVPKRGYRFIASVKVVPEEEIAVWNY